MNVGGSELCWLDDSMWLINCELKLMAACSLSVQARVGEVAPEDGEGARERLWGRGCARGAQLRVYMVRSGIS